MLAGLGSLTGCTAMDDFSFRKMNVGVFQRPTDPMDVVMNSKDGGARVRALAYITEPTSRGGSVEEQQHTLQVLKQCATKDLLPAARLAAIDRLRHFRDPAVVEILKEAYYNAGAFPNTETASVIRRQSLSALADTQHESAVDMLVTVLREPPAEGAEIDRQAKLDERLTAARELGRFQSPAAAAALAEVMAKESDVGLQRRVHESLVSITGQNLPIDGRAWTDWVNDPTNRQTIVERRPSPSLLELVGFKP
jgi:HEAT repeat protein